MEESDNEEDSVEHLGKSTLSLERKSAHLCDFGNQHNPPPPSIPPPPPQGQATGPTSLPHAHFPSSQSPTPTSYEDISSKSGNEVDKSLTLLRASLSYLISILTVWGWQSVNNAGCRPCWNRCDLCGTTPGVWTTKGSRSSLQRPRFLSPLYSTRASPYFPTGKQQLPL